MMHYDVVIVGGGFTGLAAAHTFSRRGVRVCVVESDGSVGGLAGTFQFSDGVWLEKFYHHWFNNDQYVPMLAKELGLDEEIIINSTKTGMYFNGRVWKLSNPLDLFRFKPLSLLGRIRLGLLVLRVKTIKDWHEIERLSVREWLEGLCGTEVFKVVWEPLMKAKFSIYAEEISAVWMWKKLLLRGGTRNHNGSEELAYFRGGFRRLTEAIAEEIQKAGGVIITRSAVTGVALGQDNTIQSVQTDTVNVAGSYFLFTPALPIIANIFNAVANQQWLCKLRRVRYLGNICLVLRLQKSLSQTYWLNVNDPGFPFVGVIEHTNFDSSENYGNSHIIYLSRYLTIQDPIWDYSDGDYFNYAFKHLQRMFPQIDESWVIEYKLWRSEYAQPVTERSYSSYVPGNETPYNNAFIATMAQIYPEDRGTNYAIRDGISIANSIMRRIDPDSG